MDRGSARASRRHHGGAADTPTEGGGSKLLSINSNPYPEPLPGTLHPHPTQGEADQLFSSVVEPFVGRPPYSHYFTAPGGSLHGTLLHATSLVLSRCVDESYGVAPEELHGGRYSTRAVFVALIDLIRGLRSFLPLP